MTKTAAILCCMRRIGGRRTKYAWAKAISNMIECYGHVIDIDKYGWSDDFWKAFDLLWTLGYMYSYRTCDERSCGLMPAGARAAKRMAGPGLFRFKRGAVNENQG